MVRGRTSISIDPELLEKFDKHCKENAMTVSGRIEILIKDYMEKIENKK
jgi:metal-responsive CopG/Arc/MetJ family transcriptional regulator